MDRELKIVVSIFLFFFIYGLVSYQQIGTFVTPFFLIGAIQIFVAVLFFGLNASQKGSWILAVYCGVILLYALSDNFTPILLSKIFGDGIISFVEHPVFIILSITNFFIFCAFAIYLAVKSHMNPILVATCIGLSFAACILLLFNQIHVWKPVLQIFLMLFFVGSQYIAEPKSKMLPIISYQFALIPLLEIFEYFA